MEEEKIRIKMFNYGKNFAWILAIVTTILGIIRDKLGDISIQILAFVGVFVTYFTIFFAKSIVEVKVTRDATIASLRNEIKIKENLEKELKNITDILPSVFKITKMIVEVNIDNIGGDATIIQTRHLKHLRETPLTKIKHEIEYDGDIARTAQDIKIKVSGQEVVPEIISNYVRESGKGAQRKTTFSIPINNISGKQDFWYSISANYPKCFPKLKSTEFDEYIFWKMLHDTDELEMIVNSPVELFDKKFDAIDHTGVEDPDENDTIRRANLGPTIIAKTLKWTIKRPKLGYSYRVYFRAQP